MEIRKGPYGYFAIEKLRSDSVICEYAMEIIDNKKEELFLPVYINKTFEGCELSYEFSDLISISEFEDLNLRNDGKDLNARRRAIGDLFLSVQHLLDLLINPALIITDPRFIYTNREGTIIRLCLLPIQSDKPLRLSSMDSGAIEHLLENDFFCEAITNDEASVLVYSLSSNDEELMMEESEKITNTPVPGSEKITISRSFAKPPDRLIWSGVFSIVSIIAYFVFGAAFAAISAITAAVILILYLTGIKDSQCKDKTKDLEMTDTRSQILFEDPKPGTFSCAILESMTPVDGSILKYAVYLDCTTIGSDRFLSDLYINDKTVSPIHAQIYLTQDTVYLSDCSANGNTFIDDKYITPEEKHELKNGQKISFGNIDFKITFT